MSDSTRIDINYISCSNNTWGLDEGSPNPQPLSGLPADGKVIPVNRKAYASALKLCDNSVVTTTGLEVAQCNECALDVNNHATVDVKGTFGSVEKFGAQTFSVKGGSVAKITGTLRGDRDKGCDVLVDNWSDQSYNSSTVDLTYAVHEQGRKIKVMYRFFASKIIGDNVEKLYLKSAGLTFYWWAKWIIRKILGIKVGQKGPSWF